MKPSRRQFDHFLLHSEHLKSAKLRTFETRNCEKNELEVHNSPLSSLFLPHRKCPCTSSRMPLGQFRQCEMKEEGLEQQFCVEQIFENKFYLRFITFSPWAPSSYGRSQFIELRPDVLLPQRRVMLAYNAINFNFLTSWSYKARWNSETEFLPSRWPHSILFQLTMQISASQLIR